MYTCGNNQYGQLGVGPNVDQLLMPAELPGNKWANGPPIGQVFAAGYFTLVHTEDLDAAIYTFGLNLGQLGHNNEHAVVGKTGANVVWTPKMVGLFVKEFFVSS